MPDFKSVYCIYHRHNLFICNSHSRNDLKQAAIYCQKQYFCNKYNIFIIHFFYGNVNTFSAIYYKNKKLNLSDSNKLFSHMHNNSLIIWYYLTKIINKNIVAIKRFIFIYKFFWQKQLNFSKYYDII